MNNLRKNSRSASVIGKEAGLVIFGAATGLLASAIIGPRLRKPLVLALGATGVAAAGPEIIKLVDRAVNSTATKRGSRKTLESIRHAAGKPIESAQYIDENLGEQMFIG